MHNFKMIGKMYREIAGLDKGILPVDFFCAILTGATGCCDDIFKVKNIQFCLRLEIFFLHIRSSFL